MHINLWRWQVVVWPRHWSLKNVGPYPSSGVNRGAIYTVRVLVGPFEFRRFAR